MLFSGFLPYYLLVDFSNEKEIASFLNDNELILNTLSKPIDSYVKLYDYIDNTNKFNIIKGYLFIALFMLIYIINKFIFYLVNKGKYNTLKEFNFDRKNKIISDFLPNMFLSFGFCSLSLLIYIIYEKYYLFYHTLKFGIKLLNISQFKIILALVIILYFYMTIINLLYELIVHRRSKIC